MTNYAYSEEELRESFLKSFKEKNQQLICEVPVFSRSIDVVKYNNISHEVSAIEFKLSDWKRAIKQALRVGICFDYLEICIPKPKTDRAINTVVNSCTEQGIGLYFYNYENDFFEYVLRPKHIEDVWTVQKASVINYIKGVTI
ncbi:hypothetical protein CAFE_30460 [Caprobacter fermentans]|uniref:Uncharacterized protein n=1 Tax=Caproicibacter fermentans TaxID=2576756 RepID=A0A6N8I492_9FIRM|nr:MULTISPECIES: hypothetical protein [Acutalibacteraceae]MVB12313.1 hypothetical protein [Caproicibacter fermentans]QAT50237.1 hypothetical protein EQM14_10935 [Caproiciproducens sp. NJN-50]